MIKFENTIFILRFEWNENRWSWIITWKHRWKINRYRRKSFEIRRWHNQRRYTKVKCVNLESELNRTLIFSWDSWIRNLLTNWFQQIMCQLVIEVAAASKVLWGKLHKIPMIIITGAVSAQQLQTCQSVKAYALKIKDAKVILNTQIRCLVC